MAKAEFPDQDMSEGDTLLEATERLGGLPEGGVEITHLPNHEEYDIELDVEDGDSIFLREEEFSRVINSIRAIRNKAVFLRS